MRLLLNVNGVQFDGGMIEIEEVLARVAKPLSSVVDLELEIKPQVGVCEEPHVPHFQLWSDEERIGPIGSVCET